MSTFSAGSEASRIIERPVRDIVRFESGKTLEEIGKIGNKKEVMLMFDIDGTLTRRDVEPNMKQDIKAFAKKALTKLIELEYVVYLNTGKAKSALENEPWNIKGLGYVAEHGAIIKEPGGRLYFPGGETETRQWARGIESELEKRWSKGWPAQATKDDEKEATISFIAQRQNKNEFGVFFEDLKKMLKGKAHVTLSQGTLIEITRSDISKGTAVSHLMSSRSYQLALAAGDDERDSEMLGEIRKRMGDKNVFSLMIAAEEATKTKANFKLDDFRDLLRFLSQLTNIKLPFE